MKVKDISKKRQTLAKQLADWTLKIQQFRAEMAYGKTPEKTQKLEFCVAEHTKCLHALRDLDRPREKQRAWASGRLG